eukprot:Nitzschia sp. Nitz4//scaffold55_size114948//109095//110312//NITZ4_003929-RA/size114948-processed-gene-0.85-mRNA-1//-1//CDS//3329554614//2607//frame0
MPPPPSQKGKFKPRKPVKKPTRSAAASVEEASPVSSTVAFAPSTDNATRRGERRDSRGDSTGGRGGRGGGGGRGRGRGPIPSGRVFFTGAEKSNAAATAKRGDTATAKSAKKDEQQSQSTEEVVGQLETAIGSGATGKSSILDGRTNFMGFDDEFDRDGMHGPADSSGLPVNGIMYDSDSSEEEERASKKKQDSTIIPPLELPFPTKALPTGIGASSRPVAYQAPSSAEGTEIDAFQTVSETIESPFVDTQVEESVAQEKDSWFLVQFPTRLPPLEPNAATIPQPAYSAEDPMSDIPPTETNEVDPLDLISDVVTPPVLPNNFDNKLKQTAAGRIGRIVVYKSGKTVLKLENSNETVLMNVNEGLTCDFLQQAVLIDTKESSYIELGDVHKSIVVTPDLSTANSC